MKHHFLDTIWYYNNCHDSRVLHFNNSSHFQLECYSWNIMKDYRAYSACKCFMFFESENTKLSSKVPVSGVHTHVRT